MCDPLAEEPASGDSRRSRRVRSNITLIKEDFLLPDPVKDQTEYLEKINGVVDKHCGKTIMLEKYSFRIWPLEYTSYGERCDMFDEWEQFYLPDHMFMEVIGVVKALPGHLPNAELVLMVCEDGKVYGYENDHLHLVADSLRDLFEGGVKFPGTKQYYRGQRFEKMTEDDWNKVKKSDKVCEMMEEHRKMLTEMKPSYLEHLNIIEQTLQKRIKEDFLLPDPVKDETDFLKKVSRAVDKHCGRTTMLDKYSLKIGPDPSYSCRDYRCDECSQFNFLGHMEVTGVVKTLPGHLLKAELVLMVCEDGKVYGYEDDTLHLVADSLKDLFEHGVTFPFNVQYYHGRRFEKMTEDDWNKVKKSDKVREMMEEQRKMQTEMKSSHLEHLQKCIKEDFLLPNPVKDETDFLKKVSRAVDKHCGRTTMLDKYSLKIGPDTSYSCRDYRCDECGQFNFLGHMEVIGVVKTLPGHLLKAELVLMVCEDGKVYGYEDDTLHLVADSLKDLFEYGVTFPCIVQYYHGQGFEKMPNPAEIVGKLQDQLVLDP